MISERMEKMLLNDVDTLIKPVDELAVIAADHSLDHALLLMTKNKYSLVPVLGKDSKMKGMISLALIIEAIIGIEDVYFDQLNKIKVHEAMETDYPSVSEEYELEKVSRLLVRHPFVSVVDKEGILLGIITRQEILRGTNRILHNFEKVYQVEDRSTKVDILSS
ncbi:MAG: CBS domain-containing protein [Atopostipes sp.]|nr:CBS domain-containing protein [Atopostipes sp.]